VHEEDTPRNSQRASTKGAISLGPSGNLQGRFKFLALNTGKKIIRQSWDVIPMPDTVIARVNTLGSNQPEQMIFTDRHGHLIGDSDDAEIPEECTLKKTMMLPSQQQILQKSQEWILSSSQEWMWQRILPHKMLRLMISTSPHPIYHPWRWRQLSETTLN
jgi:hypothetical protein